MATERQIVYLQQLVIDLGFSRHSRNVYIREYIGKSVEETGLEGLTVAEAHDVINYFREMKYGFDAED
jgi:hypothetical protein